MVRTRGRASKEEVATSTAYFRVLVTGANGGIGYDTCRRLIDEFLASRPESSKLHLVVSTRSATKSSSTISRLSKHVLKKHKFKPSTDNASSSSSESRVLLSAIELDLTYLPSVIRAARRLRRTISTLDALICNAGIAGWVGLRWINAIRDVLTKDLVDAVTWPSFMIDGLGLQTESQLRELSAEEKAELLEDYDGGEEPQLGLVFAANVFGHYILAHELGPLLSAAKPSTGRIIWLSSIETVAEDLPAAAVFGPEPMTTTTTTSDASSADTSAEPDIQALRRPRAYNSSKRLTDILALTSRSRATQSLTRSFLSDPSHASYKPLNPQPRQYLCHPGVVSTEIWPLPWIVAKAKELSFRMARFLGSPWHTIDGYTGSTAPVWLALSPQTTLDALEERAGGAPSKWGSATDRWGEARVKRTEVAGWGWSGRVEVKGGSGGDDSEAKERTSGRKKTAADVTEKDLEDFDRMGVRCWKELEKLREDWYELMDDAGVIDEDEE